MYDLFSTNPKTAGYRLDYMEVFNWGTFHNHVYSIRPSGNTSLLTGANGSGKTTWIDALITLLVAETRLRFYNQSSGAKKRNERSETTYVQGNYGDIIEEESQATILQKLREDKKNTYSILLAHFINPNGEKLTLFQARWFVGNDIKRVYAISTLPLTIEKDFFPFDPKGRWKSKLEKKYAKTGKKNIEYFDGPKKYTNRLLQVFGMRSEKALSLFNQIVGIKVLGNLDEFIRENMLDKIDTEKEFLKLKEHADTLLQAKRDIDKSIKKIELLSPIRSSSELITTAQKRLKQLERIQRVSAYWFSEKKITLIETELTAREQHKTLLSEKKNHSIAQLENYREQEKEIDVALRMDTVEQRINEIKKQIQNYTKEKEKAIRQKEKYDSLASTLDLIPSTNEADFNQNFQHLQTILQQKEKIIFNLGEKLFITRKELEEQEESFASGKKELNILKNQRNNISGRVSEIRNELVSELTANISDIPFVGELIRVKEEEKIWEAAIERLLHNFALRILIPQKYYDRANDYINRTNLRGRIIYHRFIEGKNYSFPQQNTEGFLYEKLEYKTNSIYTSWVENQIYSHYDYYCTQDLKEFKKYKKAMTPSGLIKSADRHEKDDRKTTGQLENYVLGWDNRDKINWWLLKLKDLQKEIRRLDEIYKKTSKQKEIQEEKLAAIHRLAEFLDYREIDWQYYSREIDSLLEEKKSLEKSNEKNRELRNNLEILKKKIKILEIENQSLIQELTRLETSIENLLQEKVRENAYLQQMTLPDEKDYSLFYQEMKEFCEDISFKNINVHLASAHKHIESEMKQSSSQLSTLKNKIISQMAAYKSPSGDVIEKFPDWLSDTYKLPLNSEYTDEYIAELNRLEKDGLPQFKKKFENYLNDTMIHKIANFNQQLDDWRERIEADIQSLNDALQGINFKKNPETYIQLKYSNRKNQKILEFRTDLRNTFPDMALWNKTEDDFQYKKNHFETNIIPLLAKLDVDKNWRDEVLDVRNWHSYYAAEYYRETAKAMKTYTEMGKLSGGEKAQLTYTILGSAIAHQFGINKEGREPRSFRFIAVDESFSNQDEEKATYLMELCNQLHLQLLVVTPSDKISIVEPYISYVHYVQRVENRESVLYDMPIVSFQEQRKKFLEKQI